ncbi:MAG TPA: rod shape-determining protein MreC [Stenomitos sp.]
MRLLQRLPAREIAFVLALVGVTAVVGWLGGRTAVLTEMLRPGWALVQSVVGSVRGGATYFQDLESLRRENAALNAKVVEVEAELLRKREVDAENARFSQLLGLEQAVAPHGIAARVIGRAPNNWQQRLVIDRGSSSGIGVDSVVLVPRGVVGRVLTVSPHTAVVSLLTDPGQTVGILDQRSRSPGVVLGEGQPTLTLQYLPQQVDYRIGDAVVTAGYGGIFPKGLNVGKVVRVESEPNAITPRVSIVLNADLDRIEEVLVLPPLSGNARL